MNSSNPMNQLTEIGRQCSVLAKTKCLCMAQGEACHFWTTSKCLLLQMWQTNDLTSQMTHFTFKTEGGIKRKWMCGFLHWSSCIKAEWVKIFGLSQPDISSSRAKMLCDANGKIVFIWGQIHWALIQTTVETHLLCQQLWNGLILFAIHDLFH